MVVNRLRPNRLPILLLAALLSGLALASPGPAPPAANHIPLCPTSVAMNLEAATVWWMDFFHGPETLTLEDVRWPDCTLTGAFRFSGPMTLEDGREVFVYRGAGVCPSCDLENL